MGLFDQGLLADPVGLPIEPTSYSYLTLDHLLC